MVLVFFRTIFLKKNDSIIDKYFYSQFDNPSKYFRILSCISISIFTILILKYNQIFFNKFVFCRFDLIEKIIATISIFIFFYVIIYIVHPMPKVECNVLYEVPYSNNEIIHITFNGYYNLLFKNNIYNETLIMFIRDKKKTNNYELKKIKYEIAHLYAGSSDKKTLLWYPELLILPLIIPEALDRYSYNLILYLLIIFILIIKIYLAYENSLKILVFFRIIKKFTGAVNNMILLNNKFIFSLKSHINGTHFQNIISTFRSIFPL